MLGKSAIKYAAWSAFVALSGHDDMFETIFDLAHNTRQGILIEHSAIPSMDRFVDSPVLDAYLFNFFKHGQFDALITGNGIPRGEVWYVLDSFDRILAAIDESLKLVARGIEVDFARDEMGRHSASNEMDMAWERED